MTLEETKDYTYWLIKLAFIVVIISWAINLLPIGRDDTDADWPSRSGMALRQDALTGCQYLESSKGHLIPRTNSQGIHLGCRPTN